MNNPFKNTYIKTEHLSPDEILELAEKYQKASGYPLERYLKGCLRCKNEMSDWKYIATFPTFKLDPEDCIATADRLEDYMRSDLKEITEEDLDNLINKSLKILVLGMKGSGKDTFCEVLKDNYGYSFESSSMQIIKDFFHLIKGVYEFSSVEEAHENREVMRPFLYQLIKGYNSLDRTRMAKRILGVNDIYCGMRDYEEVEACISAKLFDLIIWIDAEDRLGITEDESSCTVTKSQADIIIENNQTESEFLDKIRALMSTIGG